LTAPPGRSLVSKELVEVGGDEAGRFSEGMTMAVFPAARTGMTSDMNPNSGCG